MCSCTPSLHHDRRGESALYDRHLLGYRLSQVKVSLLNFTITVKGLEEQLLNTAVKEELPDLAQKKVRSLHSSMVGARPRIRYTSPVEN